MQWLTGAPTAASSGPRWRQSTSHPGAFTCQGSTATWLGFTYGEHGGEGAVIGTTDGGRTWGTSVPPAHGSAVLTPEISPSDGTAVATLGTSQSPTGVTG